MEKFISIDVDENLAREIFEAEVNCYSEGLGGIPDRILDDLSEAFPNLKKEFPWLPIFNEDRDD